MNISRSIQAVDTHTSGEATRIITGGLPVLKGGTMMEKKQYFLSHNDSIRRTCMLEPRGHANMFGAVITEPADPSCDYGVIFLDGGGCLNMCGHGTIGVSTALVELGMVEVSEPYTDLRLETPAGPVAVRVRVENGRAIEVTFRNVPAFVYRKDVSVEVPGLGAVTLDIAFGGSFFGIVGKDQLGIDELTPANLPGIVPKALALRESLNRQVEICHPLLDITEVDLIEIYGPPKDPDADVQNTVVFGQGQVDRSPCGTGTCAKLAVLTAKGKLELGQEFVHESILGTTFRARALERTRVGAYDAIVPEITGSAYITGFNDLLMDELDPFKNGFVL